MPDVLSTHMRRGDQKKPIPRQAVDYTNNDPELWRVIIRTLLHMTADILDLSPDIRTLCDTIASNVKRRLVSFPHWSIATSVLVARRACEEFDLLRNHIIGPSRSTLAWTVEGLDTSQVYPQYSTRQALIMAGSNIPSWTTPEEIAQLGLHMHDSMVLKRAGQASQHITPVGHTGVIAWSQLDVPTTSPRQNETLTQGHRNEKHPRPVKPLRKRKRCLLHNGLDC